MFKALFYRVSKVRYSESAIILFSKIKKNLSLENDVNIKGEGDGKILVECIQLTPKNNFEKLIVAKEISNKNGLEVLPLVKHIKRSSNEVHGLIDAFGISNSVSLEMMMLNPFKLAKSFLMGFHFFLKANSPEAILSKFIGDIEVGDLVYDGVIRNNLGKYTVTSLSGMMGFITAVDVYLKYYIYMELVKSKQIKVLVTSHKSYVLYGLLSRIVINNGGNVILRDNNTLNAYTTENKVSIKEHFLKPTMKAFDLFNNDDDLEKAELYLQKRLSGNINNLLAKNAYENKREYSQKEIFSKLGIEKTNRTTALILPHAFSDSPHCSKKLLFNDYYHWLAETLLAASKNKNANFLVKPHPSSYLFNEGGVVEKMVNELGADNIYIMPLDVKLSNFNKVADVLITCQGTAALEAASFGVPVLAAGDGFHSGFGITTNFSSVDEYLDRIIDMSDVDILTEQQCQIAKRVLYLSQNSFVHSSLVPFWFVLPTDDWNCKHNEIYTYMLNKIDDYSLRQDPLILHLNKIY